MRAVFIELLFSQPIALQSAVSQSAVSQSVVSQLMLPQGGVKMAGKKIIKLFFLSSVTYSKFFVEQKNIAPIFSKGVLLRDDKFSS